ncbi:Phospholipase D delta [Camellia lanceoleosa]|uniref:Phospholipase D delta n=1 Tax=Camellia lanceoleosa TaxID=1840588 RepID=A0ACC0I0D1_9ERIC|nr:Phospholipase D delta [Camellia lanceoleosa]
MAGSRDTEIAVGAYQSYQTWAKKKKHPRGQNVTLGRAPRKTKQMLQGALVCVDSVNKIVEDNWKKFTREEFTPLQGHLLKYPMKIDGNGKVSALSGQENFPDVGGKVLGARTTLPDALTT